MPTTLTEEQIEALCREHLPVLTKYIYGKMGEEASTYTGEALLRALRAYDASRGEIGPYLRTKTFLLVTDACRSVHGRRGSKKYQARANRLPVEDYDFEVEDDPGDCIEREDGLLKTLQIIERAARMQRVILFGKVLSGLNDQEIQQVADVSKEKIRLETVSLRELVSVD